MIKKTTLIFMVFFTLGSFAQTDDEVIISQLNDVLRFFKLSRSHTGVYRDVLLFDTDATNGFPVSTAGSGMGLIALAIEAELAETNPSAYSSITSIKNDVIETLKAYNGETPYMPAKSANGFFEHFTDISTGALASGYTSDFSSIDTAILMYGALIVSNKFSSDTEIVRLTNKLFSSVSWTDAIKDATGDSSFPQKIYLKFNASGAGDESAITIPFNEYILVSYLALQQEIIEANPTGKATTLWNSKFDNPNNCPSITYNDPKDNGTTTFPTLTDNSGYIPNFTYIFARYLVNHVSVNGDYSFFIEKAGQADKAWFQSLEVNPSASNAGDNYNVTYTGNINVDNYKYNNMVTSVVEDYEWGLGEGEQPAGVSYVNYLGDVENSNAFAGNEINENPVFIVSPAIIAGYIPLIAEAKSDFSNIYRNKAMAKCTFTGSLANAFPTGGNSSDIEVLWRYSLYPGDTFTSAGTTYTNPSQLSWKTDKVQSIDLAPQLLGLGASVLNFSFFQVNNIFSITQESLRTIYVSPKVYLQGAALNPNVGEETLMRDDLRVGGYLPTTSPYADAVTCGATVFDRGGASGTGTIDDDIVDWIFVELRDKTDNTIVVDSQSALLQRDGNVVGVDGISALSFSELAGDYFVVVNHRNHLGVMTSNAVSLSNTIAILDFTTMTGADLYDSVGGLNYEGNEQISVGSVQALLAGDANSDGQIGYNNAMSDINIIQLDVLLHPGNTAFNTGFSYGFGYYNSDINMDGKISYSATESDLNQLQLHVLLYPLNTTFNTGYDFIIQQLP